MRVLHDLRACLRLCGCISLCITYLNFCEMLLLAIFHISCTVIKTIKLPGIRSVSVSVGHSARGGCKLWQHTCSYTVWEFQKMFTRPFPSHGIM